MVIDVLTLLSLALASGWVMGSMQLILLGDE